jgi:GntR family transcriptional regulator
VPWKHPGRRLTETGIDRAKALPLYAQVAGVLRRGIALRHYGDAGALPSEAQLRQRFGISRVTARQALQMLADEGLIEKHQGKGSYVAGGTLRLRLGELRGFYDDLVCQGAAPQTQLIDFAAKASGEERSAELSTRLERLYRIDGEPIALVRAWLPAEALALGREAAERTTIYGLVEDGLGRRIARAETTVRALAPDAAAAAHLSTGDCGFVLAMARKSYDDFGVLCESALFLVRADRYEFVLSTEGRTAGSHMRIRAAQSDSQPRESTQQDVHQERANASRRCRNRDAQRRARKGAADGHAPSGAGGRLLRCP